MTFKIGDTVTWTSQAGGCEKRKTDKIIVVVPPGEYPTVKMVETFGLDWKRQFNHLNIMGTGLARDHESYIIAVSGKTDKAKKTLYWPVVSKLAKVTK